MIRTPALSLIIVKYKEKVGLQKLSEYWTYSCKLQFLISWVDLSQYISKFLGNIHAICGDLRD